MPLSARKFVVLVLAVVSVLMLNNQLSQGQTVTVDVVSTTKTGGPGDFITHTFTISNPGAATTFDLELTLPKGFISIGLPSSTSVAAGDMVPVFVTVMITTEALAKAHEITLTATSQTDPSNQDSATGIIDVIEIANVEILQPDSLMAQVGTQVEVKFVVSNVGNSPNEFRISANAEPQVQFAVAPDRLALLPGESAQVIVTVDVPLKIKTGIIVITFQADSILDPQVKAQVKATIELLPPSASAFSTNLNLEIPLRLQGAVDPILGSSSTQLPLDAIVDLVLPRGPRFVLTIRESNLADSVFAPKFSTALRFSDMAVFFDSGGRVSATLELDPFFIAAALDENSTTYRGRLAARFGPARVSGGFTVSQFAGDMPNTKGISSQTTSSIGFPLGPVNVNVGLIQNTPAVFLGPDKTAVTVSASFSESTFSTVVDLAFSVENLSQNDEFSTLTDGEANIEGRLSLGENVPVMVFGIETEGSEGLGPAGTFLINNKSNKLFFDARQTFFSVFDVEYFTDISHLVNAAIGTRLTVERSLLTMDLDVDILRFMLDLERTRTKDDVINTIIEGENSIVGAVSIFLKSLSFTLRMGRTDEITLNDVLLSKAYNIDSAFAFLANDLTFTTVASLVFEENAGLTANVSLEFNTLFTFPTMILAKGQVEGFLFVDLNENGKRDNGEPGVPKAIVEINEFKVLSDTQSPGFYRSPPLDPGEYEIQLESLQATVIPGVPLPIIINLVEGQRLTLNIPVVPVSTIDGIVFNDTNQDGKQGIDEPGLADIGILLDGPTIEPLTLLTDSGGRFSFTNLPAGTYVVAVDESTFPVRFELTTPGQITVKLGIGQRKELAFGAFQKPQQILFAPSADFSFSPARPKVGEVVVFDASASLDFDGEIVNYEWDFNGDGITDAMGIMVQHVFEQSGRFSVTLTVTDNDGKVGVKGPVPVEIGD